MVFGFGFNKTKILASAERNVKQGKLQNAIADYEKILAEDPKDLTVMNTVGDLYARVGNTEKATEYFRKIGDAYANEGFTVRAIAMYKKLTKQNTGALDAVLKLGELYTQQGLYNDARAQFMQVAENYLRNNDLQQAASVFQKTLELDPENTSLQTRLAELYVKIGRKSDARDLYFRNAEGLRARGALDLADDALGRVMSLDPNFAPAALLRGQVRFDSGDPEGAVQALEQIPDIDSRPEGLRTLLGAYLALGKLDAAEPAARKMLQVFNDCSGIVGYGEALLAAGSYEACLKLFTENAAVLLASNQAGFMQTLQALTARVKSNPRALEQLSSIFARTGNTGLNVEVTELLAHSYVQEGELAKARDLYQRLTQLEPENPQHAQNFRQMVARIAESMPPAPVQQQEEEEEEEPAVQAPANTFSADEMLPASMVEQKYPGDLTELIEAALTDAELFDSYNLLAKAIAPLEILLPRVPYDVRINQRLASLYARAGRLKDAADRFVALEQVHLQAGFLKDSRFYAELAAKYRVRAGIPAEPAAPAPPPKQQSAAPDVAVQPQRPAPQAPLPPRQAPADIASPVQRPVPTSPAAPVASMSASAAAAPAPQAPPPVSHEIDLSDEWEQMFEVEQQPTVAPPVMQAVAPPTPAFHEPVVPPPAFDPPISKAEPSVSVWDVAEDQEQDPVSDLLDEVRFYISQSMWPEARNAFERCELLAPGHPEVLRLRQQLGGATATVSAESQAEVTDFEIISDASADEALTEKITSDPLLMSPAVEGSAATSSAAPVVAPIEYEIERPASTVEPEEWKIEQELETRSVVPNVAPHIAPVVPAFEPVAPAPAPVPQEPPAAEPSLDSFVHDLEVSLGDEFEIEADEPRPVPPPVAPAPLQRTEPAPVMSAAVPSVPSAPVAPPPPVAHTEVPIAAPVIAPTVPAAPPATEPQPAPTITPDEERNELSDMFAEFKESVEPETESEEDPETHYNLGIAYKEMDLFDEAIGEFQKVCKAIERGYPFSQSVQAYTWLADCFLKRGVPDLAVRWYERALKSEKVDPDTDNAIRYELACACEAAGDRRAALHHFMEVYGINIDYRDVAERIKALRS